MKPHVKIIHRASVVRGDGAVSALCYKRPRPINLARTTWTNRNEATTCPKCLAALESEGQWRRSLPGIKDQSCAIPIGVIRLKARQP